MTINNLKNYIIIGEVLTNETGKLPVSGCGAGLSFQICLANAKPLDPEGPDVYIMVVGPTGAEGGGGAGQTCIFW